jgi:hypothetical protein
MWYPNFLNALSCAVPTLRMSVNRAKGTISEILCTGAFLYALYSFLLLSSKFWTGGRVGGAVQLCYLTALVR